jgi:DNA-binding transcriptional LysR family regulator
MELRHLRVFVTVAEELHFGRAAQRLHLTQPSVSGQIRQLETELTVRLLNRSAREVMLTNAGTRFLKDARRIVAQADAALASAKATLDGEDTPLRVGYVTDALPRALPVALRRLAAAGHEPQIQFTSNEAPLLLAQIRDGSLDIAVISLPAPTDGLSVTVLGREDAIVAVRATPFDGHEQTVPLELVAHGTVLTRPRRTNPGFYDGVSAAFNNAGLPSPLTEVEGATVDHLLLRVAAGKEMALLPGSVADRLDSPGVQLRRITHTQPIGSEIAAVTRRDIADPGFGLFVQALAKPEAQRSLRSVPTAA